jgi:hypothetical protein
MAYPSILELFIESIFKFIFGKDNLKIKNYADFKKKTPIKFYECALKT